MGSIELMFIILYVPAIIIIYGSFFYIMNKHKERRVCGRCKHLAECIIKTYPNDWAHPADWEGCSKWEK